LWEFSLAGSIVGATGINDGPMAGPIDLAIRANCLRAVPSPGKPTPSLVHVAALLRNNFVQQRDDGPPGALYLAVRAARRAIAANPNSPTAYLSLAEAYLRLMENSSERAVSRASTELYLLRQIQVVTALHDVLVLQPDNPIAHYQLAILYEKIGYMDLALKHLQEHLRAARKAGPLQSEKKERFDQRIQALEKTAEQLGTEVQKRLDLVEVNTVNLKATLPKARAAMERNLPGKALATLLAANVADFGVQGLELELRLLLTTGRARDANSWLEEKHKESLRGDLYHQLRLQIAAALGNYASADRELLNLHDHLDVVPTKEKVPLSRRAVSSRFAAQAVLAGSLGTGGPCRGIWVLQEQMSFLEIARTFIATLRNQADIQTYRGLFALEQGDVARAREAFESAVSIGGNEPNFIPSGKLDFATRSLAQDRLRRFSLLTR
jgi:tetratricopeptide (TPR) repeat protein